MKQLSILLACIVLTFKLQASGVDPSLLESFYLQNAKNISDEQKQDLVNIMRTEVSHLTRKTFYCGAVMGVCCLNRYTIFSCTPTTCLQVACVAGISGSCCQLCTGMVAHDLLQGVINQMVENGMIHSKTMKDRD